MQVFKLISVIVLSIILLLSLPGCLKEDYINIDPEKEVFNFEVTENQRLYINSTRGLQYEIADPLPVLHFSGKTYLVDRFEIRGDNTLNFVRKGFSVNMDNKIRLYSPTALAERKYEEFKLLAMVYDYTYIENSTAVGLFKLVNLWPVFSFFTEVRLNDHTQGLYHFIEDPFEYFIEQENAGCVIRRGYDHVVKASSKATESQTSIETYKARFEKIYSQLPSYSGRQLYDSLSSYMDMEQYFTKLSIDLIVKNGDYTDEVIFYSKYKNDREIFGIFPWDYDDIFADQPHEIGNPWATGSTFGQRSYFTMDDILADVGSKLLFSIEDDLDYKIAKDDFLYQQYLNKLRNVVEIIDDAAIDRVFEYTYDHISPFYENDSIIAQSRYDVDQTNNDLFVSNIAEKRQMLKDRRKWIIEQLDLQQKRQ
jgi:hypothetical protein